MTTPASSDRAHDADDFLDFDWIETGHDLVEQQQLGPGCQGARKLEPLAPGQRERVGAHVELSAQTDPASHIVCLGSRLASEARGVVGADHNVLEHAEAGKGLRDLERARDAARADAMRRQARNSRPRNRTLPPSGLVKPAMHANSVVLPAPFGPIRATISCAPTSSDTWSTAARPPKAFESPLTSSTALFLAASPKQPCQAVGQPGDNGDQNGAVDDDAQWLSVADPRQHVAEVARQLANDVQHA